MQAMRNSGADCEHLLRLDTGWFEPTLKNEKIKVPPLVSQGLQERYAQQLQLDVTTTGGEIPGENLRYKDPESIQNQDLENMCSNDQHPPIVQALAFAEILRTLLKVLQHEDDQLRALRVCMRHVCNYLNQHRQVVVHRNNVARERRIRRGRGQGRNRTRDLFLALLVMLLQTPPALPPSAKQTELEAPTALAPVNQLSPFPSTPPPPMSLVPRFPWKVPRPFVNQTEVPPSSDSFEEMMQWAERQLVLGNLDEAETVLTLDELQKFASRVFPELPKLTTANLLKSINFLLENGDRTELTERFSPELMQTILHDPDSMRILGLCKEKGVLGNVIRKRAVKNMLVDGGRFDVVLLLNVESKLSIQDRTTMLTNAMFTDDMPIPEIVATWNEDIIRQKFNASDTTLMAVLETRLREVEDNTVKTSVLDFAFKMYPQHSGIIQRLKNEYYNHPVVKESGILPSPWMMWGTLGYALTTMTQNAIDVVTNIA